MTWTQLSQQVSSIPPADRGAMEAARRRWDAIAKPLQGLGRLEDLLVRMAGVTGSPDLDLDRKAVAVFCADNGVVAEGVTQTGQEVTWTVAQTMGERRSSVCHMARTAGAQVFPSEANYLFFRWRDGKLPEELLKYGILIRSCKNYHSLDETYYRIAVRTAEENRAFAAALRQIAGQKG